MSTRAERDMSKCNEPLSLDLGSRRAFADRQAKLIANSKWPMQNWYNDEDFCRAYNMAVALADRVVELEVEVKWLRCLNVVAEAAEGASKMFNQPTIIINGKPTPAPIEDGVYVTQTRWDKMIENGKRAEILTGIIPIAGTGWEKVACILMDEVEKLRTHFCVSASEVSDVPCVGCGGPVIEFVIPSEIWNAVVRGGGPERDDEYLCYACWLAAVYRQSQCIRRLEEENAGLRALQQEAVVVNMDPFVEAARCQCGWDSAALVRISGKMTCGSESRS